MSSYLRFFELERSPFDGAGQTQVVLGTRAVRDAFATIRSGLEAGDSRICVSGEAGMGKTSLARALPKLLGERARVAVVPDPTIGWEAARSAIARQWGVGAGGLARPALLAIRSDRPLVLVIDQAECANDDFLDHLDVLLCYRTPDDQPVVQSVLMAKLSSADGQAAATPLHWWLDRIHTLQLEFAPLPIEGVAPYIEKHLRRAGWRGSVLFDDAAAAAIHGYTSGVPGAISELCERLLIEAARRSLDAIDARFVETFCEAPAVADEAADEIDETGVDDGTDEVGVDSTATLEAALVDDPDGSDAPDSADTNEAGFDAESASEASDDPDRAGDDEAVALDLVDVASEAPETAEATATETSMSEIDLEAALDYFEGATAKPGPADAPTAVDASESLPDDGPAEEPASDLAWASDGDSTEAAEDALAGPEVDCGDDRDGTETDTEPEPEAVTDAAFAGPSPWATDWATEGADDALLLSPPSEEEMRALRGSPWQRFARPLAGALAAILVGGLGLALLSSDDTPATTAASRPATMLPGEAAGPSRENAPSLLADYARGGGGGGGGDARVIFAPGAGFVRPERSEDETGLAATEDAKPTHGEAALDANEEAAEAPETETEGRLAATDASAPPIVVAPLEAGPSSAERAAVDRTQPDSADTTAATPTPAPDPTPMEIASANDSDSTVVLVESPSRAPGATPEPAPALDGAGPATPAAPSPLADGDR